MAVAQRGFVAGQDGTPVAERKPSDRRAIPPGPLPACARGHAHASPQRSPSRWSQSERAPILNSDSAIYDGSNVGNAGAVTAENSPSDRMPFSLTLRLLTLNVLWLEVPRETLRVNNAFGCE